MLESLLGSPNSGSQPYFETLIEQVTDVELSISVFGDVGHPINSSLMSRFPVLYFHILWGGVTEMSQAHDEARAQG